MSEAAHQVAKAMKKSMEESRLHGSFDKRSIYKLPPYVTAAFSPNSYTPQVVSFGPYHHGSSHLKPMEEHKWRVLRHFIDRASRDSTRSVDLEALVSGVSEVVQDLMDCYDSLDPVWQEEDNFVKLMVLDGCFMLEVLRNMKSVTDYDHNDPIFSDHGKVNILPFIRRDMLLLENQLPMLLLDTLLALETGQNKEMSHHQSAVHFIMEIISPGKSLDLGTCLHVLDAHRKCMIHGTPGRRHPMVGHDFEFDLDIGFQTATELHEAGIKFKISGVDSVRDISFDRGVLRLPGFIIDDTTESMLLNSSAFERLHVGAETYIVSYIFFMENLIHSERDVALLRSKGIIQNIIGSDEEVAKMFKSLARDQTIDIMKDDHFPVLRAVNRYRKKWRHIADLKNTYFRSPWASISIVAAILLFALTFTMTYYTVFPNNNK